MSSTNVRLTPQQQFAIKLLMQAHANGRTSVNRAVLKLNGKTRHSLRDKGVIGFDDSPFEFEGITLVSGRYTLTDEGLALGHRLHPDVLWCPVDVDESPCIVTVLDHTSHYNTARLEAERVAIQQLGDELNSTATGIADALETAPATNNQHFASPAHDDRKLCRTCRQPIVATSATAFKHKRVADRSMANYTCGGVTGHSSACDRETCIRLPDLKPGTFIEAVPVGATTDGPITSPARVRIDRQPWLTKAKHVVLSNERGTTHVHPGSIRVVTERRAAGIADALETSPKCVVRPAVRALIDSLDPAREYAITPDLVAHEITRQGTNVPGSPIVFYDNDSGREIGLAFSGNYIRVSTTDIRRLKASVRDGHFQWTSTRLIVEALNAQDEENTTDDDKGEKL